MEFACVTDVGRQRKNNEDSYFIYRNDYLCGGLVADGMGGHTSGELASRMAADIIKQYIITKYNPKMDYMEMAELLKTAFVVANAEIYKAAKRPENNGMGTTATLAFLYQERLICVHVGDSRCYLISDDGIEQITNDHSFVGELLRNGQITEPEAMYHPNKNLITRALGAELTVKSDINMSGYKNETVLICSDGLTNMLSDEQILEIINKTENLDTALHKMVELANKKGGNDNITAVAFRNVKGEA